MGLTRGWRMPLARKWASTWGLIQGRTHELRVVGVEKGNVPAFHNGCAVGEGVESVGAEPQARRRFQALPMSYLGDVLEAHFHEIPFHPGPGNPGDEYGRILGKPAWDRIWNSRDRVTSARIARKNGLLNGKTKGIPDFQGCEINPTRAKICFFRWNLGFSWTWIG